VLALVAALYFLFSYAVNGTRPGPITPLGWYGQSDQGAYLAMAKLLANFESVRSNFFYGLGYPLTAVPSLWAGFDYDPFLPFDTLAFAFAAGATYVLGRRIGGGLVGFLSWFGLVFASPFLGYTLTPWNSTLSLTALMAVLLLATSPTRRNWHPAAMGALAGVGYLARYADIAWYLPIALVAGLTGTPALRHRLRDAGVTIVAAVATAAPNMIASAILLGGIFTTPYAGRRVGSGSEQTFAAYSIERVPKSFLGEFVTPYFFGQGQPGAALLPQMWWLVFVVPGAYIVLRARSAHRRVLATAIVASLVSTVFYLSFHGSGAGLVQFGSLHYLKAWWPLWSVISMVGLVRVLDLSATLLRSPATLSAAEVKPASEDVSADVVEE
jgi:hypothetical protein